ncbi:MAG: hypothetical protein KF819_24070 [Labilithrix sp.]|nr:hypothetical protein [Labilithrix sp.]
MVTAMLGIWGLFTYACAVEDENPANPRRQSQVEGGTPSPTDLPDAPTGAPICGKYGGYDQMKEMAAGILARAQADCRISQGFARANGQDMAHLAGCFEIMVGGAFQCPGVSYVANTTALPDGHKCRDMTRAHQGMQLREADFNAFLEAIAGELQARGLTTDEVRAIVAVFNGSKGGVVQQNNQPNRNTYCSCENGLYEGKPCLPEAGIIDAGNDVNDAADAAND